MQNNHLLSHVKPGGRTFSVLVTLLVTAMTLLPQSVWGQTEYGLTVGGVVVTSENAGNITGGNILGTVSFDVQTSALTLNGATITGNIVVTDLTSLTINVVGENTINAGASSALQSNVATTSCALTFQRASDLDCSLALNSEGVTVISTGFSTPEYQALGLVVDGLDENYDPDYYTQYGLAYYDSNTQSYPAITSATITSYTTYDIIVNGEAVTNLNKNKIRKGAVGVGHITFDGEHTLTLNNVPNAVFDGQYPFIQTSMDLTIHLVGNNAFDCGQNVFITRMPGDNDTHTVTFTTDANNPGLLALTVGDQFDGFGKAFENNLQWCPDGYYDSQATDVPVAWVAQPFESYNLTVGGVTVTKANANKITGAYIQGTVSFNPSTNTLTLNDAIISGTTISNGCIVSGLSSLNIVLKGYNTLDCSQDSCTAIRSVANAALTITKGEDECSLGFYGSRAIRDFKSVTLSGMAWDRTCAYQLATINNNGEHTGMMLYDTVEDEIGEINIFDAENLPLPSMYASSNQQNEPTFGFEGDPSWEIRYSIDYVDESLADVTNALYNMQGENVPLQGAATVTAWTVFGDATSDEVKGKLFELSETSLSTVYGTAETLSAPTLRPAIEPEQDRISVSYTGAEQSDVATIDPTTGEVTILGLGTESFSVNIDIEQENGCTVLNVESLPFEVNVLNSYPLYIGDTQVTEANADDMLGDGKVSFTVSGGQEAAPTYTLTLNGAALTAPVKVGLANLTFDIHGTNTITTDGTCIQNVAGSESMPSLTFKSTSDEVGSLTLTNNNGRISEIGQNNISVSNELAVFLTVNDTEDCTSNLYYMTDGSTTVAKFVPSYGVQVGEMQVYAGNAADVLGDGTISFNKETNTLTLNGANAGALCTSLAELTVELIGNNTLSEGGSYPVLRSLSGDAVIINVQSTADVMGTLTMNMPYTQAGNFCEDQVTLNIVAPLEVVSGSLKGNDDNNNTVVIGPNYGITITSAGGSYPITSDNRLDVLGDGGSVQFDGKNTLILNGAWVSSVILGADDSWVKKGLTIYLKGDNNNIGEQEQDGLIYQGQGASVPLTFATGDVEPGTLTLSYSDQPLVGFTPTYMNNLTDLMNTDLHQITIAVSMEPFVTQSGEEKTEDGHGVGLGKDIENAGTSTLTVGILVNNILYVLPDADDGYLMEDGKKVVEINSSMTDAEANTIMAAVINGTLLPGTPAFASAFQGMTFLLPAGNGDIVLDVNTNQSGELHVMVGNNDPVVISGTTGFEERRIPYALTEASYVFIYNVTSAPSSSRRSAGHRAPGRKETTTVGIKGLSVSASDVSPAPGPALSPKKLDKSLMIKEGNHITVNDMDIEDIEVDAFDELSGDITYVDLRQTSIKGMSVNRMLSDNLFKKLPEKTFIYLPAGNMVITGTKNVVVGSVCNDMELDAAAPFEASKDFVAVKAVHARDFSTMLDKNCTVYLPFAIDAETAASLGTFYELKGYDGTTVSMESVTETKANTPYMFKPKAADTKVAAKMVTVKAAPAAAPVAGNMKFVGTYEQKKIVSDGSTQYYCFMADGAEAGKFVHVITTPVTMNPYRAYMVVEGAASRELDLVIDGVSTGIKNMKVGTDDNVYYDLQGRRVLYPTKGLYIVNGRKVIIK